MITNRTWNSTLLGTASAIFLGLSLLQPAAAQCLAKTEAQAGAYPIASGDWSTASAVSLDATNLNDGSSGAAIALAPSVQFASSGAGSNYLLSQGVLYKVSVGTVPGTQTTGILSSSPQSVIGIQRIQFFGGQLYGWGAALQAPVLPLAGPTTGGPIAGVTFDGYYLWAASQGSLWKMTPAYSYTDGQGNTTTTGLTSVATYTMPAGVTLGDLAFDRNYLWMVSSNASGQGLMKIDPASGRQVGFVNTGVAGPLTFDGQYLWFSNGQGGLSEMDPVTMSIATVSAGGNSVSSALTFDGNAIWAADASLNQADLVEACNGDYLGSMTLPTQPAQVVFNGSHYWITYQQGRLSIR
ncbi:MAG: hypothetical protein ABSH56_18425 [Bryobacteraceae bacterium]